MRKTLRIVVVALLVLSGLVALGGLTVQAVSSRMLGGTHALELPELELDRSSRSLERGRYLVDALLGCKECHAADLGGGVVVDDAGLGRLVAPNLTAGKGSATSGLGSAGWDRAIRHGIGRDGRALLLMPSGDYWSFADGDVAAVVAYAQSLPAVDRELPATRLGPIGRLLLVSGKLPLACERLDHAAPRPAAEPGPTREWGAVLAGTCAGCHGRDFGGGPVPGAPPDWPRARDIRPVAGQGIGDWSEEDFDRALTQGLRPDGAKLSEVMPWRAYASLSAEDRRALWLHLRGLPGG